MCFTLYLIANGDGSRQPSEKELAIAETQGENFAKLLNTMHKGQATQVNGEKKEKTSQQDKPKEAPTTTRAAAPKPAPKDDEEPKKKNKCFCM